MELSAMYMPKIYERLKSKTRIDESTGCWIWTGFVHTKRPHPGNRYGGTSIPAPGTPRAAKTMHAHRAMMWVIHGPLTPQQCVCHKCDVPTCINPDHLFIGSMKDNIWDSRRKGRHYESRRDHCERGHPLFGENLWTCKDGRRHCKTCSRAKGRLKAGWPPDLAWTLPPQPLGRKPKQLSASAEPK